MKNIYLTIDDSPSSRTDDLVNALYERGVSALLFCRGDLAEKNKEPLIRAIKKNMVLGSHAHNHVRSGTLSFDENVENIRRADTVIDECYQTVGIERPGKYFRFPYIDRGDGDTLERRFFDIIKSVQNGVDPEIPTPDSVTALQDFLRDDGFTQPFNNVKHPLYSVSEIVNAQDCLFTYSTGDWMLNARHKGKEKLSSVKGLIDAMNDDPWLMRGEGAQIILMHDHDEIFDAVIAMIDHLLDNDFVFEKVEK